MFVSGRVEAQNPDQVAEGLNAMGQKQQLIEQMQLEIRSLEAQMRSLAVWENRVGAILYTINIGFMNHKSFMLVGL